MRMADANRSTLQLRVVQPDAPTVEQGTQPPDDRPPPGGGAESIRRKIPVSIAPSYPERPPIRQILFPHGRGPPGGGSQPRQPPPAQQAIALSVVPSKKRQDEEPRCTYVNPPPLDPHGGAPRVAAAMARGAGDMFQAGLPVAYNLGQASFLLTANAARAIRDTGQAGLIQGLEQYEQNREAIHSAVGAAARGAANATRAIGYVAGGAGSLGLRAVGVLVV